MSFNGLGTAEPWVLEYFSTCPAQQLLIVPGFTAEPAVLVCSCGQGLGQASGKLERCQEVFLGLLGKDEDHSA